MLVLLCITIDACMNMCHQVVVCASEEAATEFREAYGSVEITRGNSSSAVKYCGELLFGITDRCEKGILTRNRSNPMLGQYKHTHLG